MIEPGQVLRSFPETRWSLVARAGHASVEVKRRALAELLNRYRPAFMKFLVATKRIKPDLAEELVQGFVADKVLERNLIARAEQGRGKFRSFMVKALSNYMIDQFRARGEAMLDVDEHLDSLETPDLAAEFTVAWARRVLAETYRHMRAECELAGRLHIWKIFEDRVITPTLEGSRPPSYQELAAKYGFRSPKEAGNVFVSGRRMFERVLRAVIAEYAADQAEVDAEIGALISALAQAPSR